MPAGVEEKRLGQSIGGGPAAKGHPRDGKGRVKNETDRERFASEGAEVDSAVGEEGEDQDVLRERKGL